MSSYLNFYLVPKKTEEDTKEQKPLLFTSYSRASDIYHVYKDNLNISYAGIEVQYTELTESDASLVIEDVKNNLEKAKIGLENRSHTYKELPNLSQEIVNNFIEDYSSTQEYIKELEDTLKELQFIANIVSDISIGFTDFEKVLINID